MQLTDRDLDVLEAINDYRLVTRFHIQRLFFSEGAASAAKRRLALLFQHGYVDRIHVPVRNSYGALRTVYRLDRKGVEVLNQVRGWQLSAWRTRDQDREATFLDHHLDMVDVRLAFTVACRKNRLRLEWTDERELRRRGVIHRATHNSKDAVTIIPDAYFTLASARALDGFALEVDRGTVTERRMRARFRAYGQWAAAGGYQRHFPAKSFRVIVAVTASGRDRKRLQTLKRWCEEERGGSLFWFVARASLDDDVIAQPVWSIAGSSLAQSLALTSTGHRDST
jgi:hypothetical protein